MKNQSKGKKQVMCHIKNTQPPPRHWSICASLVYEAIRVTVIGVSIPKLDKAFRINITGDKGSDSGGKVTNAYLNAIASMDVMCVTQKSDIEKGKRN